jgi:signal transduction histidine kinase
VSNIIKKIDEARQQITKLENILCNPEHAHASRAELETALILQIAAWHDQATERVSSDLRRIAAGSTLVELLSPEVLDVALDPSVALREVVSETRAWLTFALGKAEMLKRFKPLLERMPTGFDAKERAAHLTNIQRQIVQAEVLEEQLLQEAEAQGINVDPRPGQRAEAAILLGYGGRE